MKKGKYITVAVLALFGAICSGVIFSGCDLFKDKSEAGAVVIGLFNAVNSRDFDKALTYYSSDFFETTSREDWSQALNGINKKLGDLEKYKLTNWQGRKSAGSKGNGSWVTLTYEVTYSKYTAKETFYLYKPLVGGQFEIDNHEVISLGLFLE